MTQAWQNKCSGARGKTQSNGANRYKSLAFSGEKG